jgi:hypothetical protein
MSTPKPSKAEDVSFGPGADRRLSRAVLDASAAARRAAEGSPRAQMLDALRTAAAGVAAALAATRGISTQEDPPEVRRRKATTALLVACGGLEQAIRVMAPTATTRRSAQRVETSTDKADKADESAA